MAGGALLGALTLLVSGLAGHFVAFAWSSARIFAGSVRLRMPHRPAKGFSRWLASHLWAHCKSHPEELRAVAWRAAPFPFLFLALAFGVALPAIIHLGAGRLPRLVVVAGCLALAATMLAARVGVALALARLWATASLPDFEQRATERDQERAALAQAEAMSKEIGEMPKTKDGRAGQAKGRPRL